MSVMNRSEFFSKVKNDLKQTVKEIVSPLIEDDIEKIDTIIEKISNVKWYPLDYYNSDAKYEIHDIFLNNRFIGIYSNGHELKALDKECLECNSIVQWLSYKKEFKCFNCDTHYSIEDNNGDLKLRFYSLKEKNGKQFIAMS